MGRGGRRGFQGKERENSTGGGNEILAGPLLVRVNPTETLRGGGILKDKSSKRPLGNVPPHLTNRKPKVVL